MSAHTSHNRPLCEMAKNGVVDKIIKIKEYEQLRVKLDNSEIKFGSYYPAKTLVEAATAPSRCDVVGKRGRQRSRTMKRKIRY